MVALTAIIIIIIILALRNVVKVLHLQIIGGGGGEHGLGEEGLETGLKGTASVGNKATGRVEGARIDQQEETRQEHHQSGLTKRRASLPWWHQ